MKKTRAKKSGSAKVDQAFMDLQDQLRQLSLLDFAAFCQITGVDPKQAVICLGKKKGLTHGQMAVQYGIPRTSVGTICERCP